MAFGYAEEDYDVTERAQSQSAAGVTHYEVRSVRVNPERRRFFDSLPEHLKAKTLPAGLLKRYIAIFGEPGQQTAHADHLLLYEGNDEELNEDWARLIGPEPVKLEDLRWTEHVEGHGWGKRRDGCICMY
ncbi:hypothetical protein [Burkholderia cenocepacia]|uniref:hypothetical protein n=1 Tax=Burkholderia cenocepacia TaxID=95486 RepID=UPI0007610943|nr:hypothetical protein [Burkholderia cenocepacia]KWU24723.1 hypothetical protein AS149_31755 [Burkholderia cenocepacia]